MGAVETDAGDVALELVAGRARGDRAAGRRRRPRREAVGIGFEAPPGERFFGFGSRSDAVDHRGRDVENYVEDGPTRESDRNYPRAFVPPWAHGERDDSTYFPVPWLLSSRGYGVLIDRDERSRFRLGTERADAWSLEADAPALALRVFAGPRPRDALRRFTAATGRQPRRRRRGRSARGSRPASRTASSSTRRREIIAAQRDADVPSRRPRRRCTSCPAGPTATTPSTTPRARRQFHAAGLAHLVYFNPSLCASYQPVWDDAAAQGLLIREPTGQPHVYPAFVGGSGPAGFTTEPLSQFDFTAPGIDAFYGALLGEAVDGGHDGWMEDFGEGVPPTGVAADGSTGTRPAQPLPDRLPLRGAAHPRDAQAGRGAPPALGLDRHGALRGGRVGRRPDHHVGLRRARVRRQAGARDRHVGREPLRHRHRRLQHLRHRGTADAGAAHSLDRVRRGVGRDAHEALRARLPVLQAPAGLRPGDPSALAPLHEAAHAALPVHPRRRLRTTGAPGCR